MLRGWLRFERDSLFDEVHIINESIELSCRVTGVGEVSLVSRGG